MKKEEIDKIIENHMLWLEDDSKGEAGILPAVDLSRIDLSNMNFQYAVFKGTKLCAADFTCSDLQHCTFHNADLRSVNFGSTDLRDCDFLGADLRNSDFSYADIRNVNIKNAIGNGTTFKTIQANHYDIIYSSDVMAIGCKQYDLKDWWEFNDETIADMDVGNSLNWWKVWKPILQNIIEVSPAIPTGYEEKK